MPDYNIYYFVIKPLRILAASGRSGETLFATSSDSTVVRDIFANFRTELVAIMDQAKQHIPRRQSRNQTINVIEIPGQRDNPTSPNFSGLSIQMHEPIVYFTTRELEERPQDPVNRRPEYVMLNAIRDARSQEFPDSWVRDSKTVLRSIGEHNGLALPGLPDISSPVTASVYSDGRQNFGASNWEELLYKNLAKAAFHEIVHCKAETVSRPTNPRWEKAINDPSRPEPPPVRSNSRYENIHDIPNVSVLASNGVGRSVEPTDLTLMGEHMLCPINFYRLDQSISNQCFRRGSAVTLTPR